ncbi:MAG TPA: hypothetical protein VER76_10730 [Pyrinomonadaceae bacterium]|nr:hypothetical protein [Pyrinomonadaceae bacterium]
MSNEDDELPLIGEDAGASVVPRAFAPGEMVACESCLRANAPTRMNCLYCGAALPVSDAGNDLRRPSLRALEAWEQGFNVVLVPHGGASAAADVLSVDSLSAAATLLRVEAGQLRGMREAGGALPLARAASREEASLVEGKLRALGWQVEIVADEDLAVEKQAPKRIRKLEIGAAALAGWTSAESAPESVAWERVALFVAGRIARKRIEVEERRGGGGGRRGAEGEVVETREFHEDERALDLYFVESIVNWRIMAENFDYSCLGAEKRLTAAENFKRLIETLRARAPRAVYDDAYRSVRPFLKFAWPLAEQTEAGNLRRIRPGRYNAEAVTSVSNETQFTRYGRLLQYFRLRELSPPT